MCGILVTALRQTRAQKMILKITKMKFGGLSYSILRNAAVVFVLAIIRASI